MKKTTIFIILCLFLFITNVKASLPLSGKLIIIDPGHGGTDAGTSYQNVLEKDLNLSISQKLEKLLIKNGASVILTRTGDYDLSSPDAERRKKSDFDNRIALINNSHANMYLSLHINYLINPNYAGPQVFYYHQENQKIAQKVQDKLNEMGVNREIKPMPNVYMYQHLKVPGVLIECGFLSNYQERSNLQSASYQETLAQKITAGIIDYWT
jgi:N-acetylmuramoyl-L-alanine amidase